MVKIESVEELQRIKSSDYGFIITLDYQSKASLHKPTCKWITEEFYLSSKKDNNQTKFHWFSSFSLAEKEFPDIISCKICNA